LGTGTLNSRSAGQTILDTFFNDIHSAMNVDFIGRNSAGVPTSGQNLGTAALPWGAIRADTLILDGAAVDTSQIVSPVNRVISGKVRTTSNQPQFITPNGAALSFILDGTPVNLVVDINGTTVSVTTDITKSSLTAAPSSNNTCLVNDTTAADQFDTRMWGNPWHRRDSITVDTMGSEITALVGTFQSFSHGSEYFHAYVESTTKLSRIFRGFFYNSSLAPVNPDVFSNNDVITLLKTGYVFVEDDGLTVDVTYRAPTISFTSPSSPATGDYWYDLSVDLWKRYDGASFVSIDRTFIGYVANTTTACVGARCIDFHANHESQLQMEIGVSTTEIAIQTSQESRVSVSGNDFNFKETLLSWNITTDLATSADMINATEQASTVYHLFLTDQGQTKISDIHPYFRADLKGWYHPHNPWRAVGLMFNGSSSTVTNASSRGGNNNETHIGVGNGFGSTNTGMRKFSSVVINKGAALVYVSSATLGDSWTCYEPRLINIGYTDGGSAVTYGLVKNTATPTALVNSGLAAGEVIAYMSSATSQQVTVSASVFAKYGDEFQCGTDTGPSVTTITQSFVRTTTGKEV